MTRTFRIDDIENEAAHIRQRLDSLSVEMAGLSRRLRDLDGALIAFQRLENPERDEEPSIFGFEADIDLTDRKRVPSTEMVTALIEGYPGPLSRDEVHDRFQRSYPDVVANWSNPINALNNAIARSVEKGSVLEVQPNLFLHRTHAPHFGFEVRD